jgi:hypothetical protein
MTARPFVIVLDRATPEERAAVHEIIKANAKGWWHHFADTWIVGGKTAQTWTQLLKPALPTGQSSILIFRLPANPAPADWSYFGIDGQKRLRWMYDTFEK